MKNPKLQRGKTARATRRSRSRLQRRVSRPTFRVGQMIRAKLSNDIAIVTAIDGDTVIARPAVVQYVIHKAGRNLWEGM